jgi:hypothetical protein
MATSVSSLVARGQCVKLTAVYHLVLRFRMGGAILPFPPTGLQRVYRDFTFILTF